MYDPDAPGSLGPDSFDELLRQLEGLHRRELDELRSELERAYVHNLEGRLKGPGGPSNELRCGANLRAGECPLNGSSRDTTPAVELDSSTLATLLATELPLDEETPKRGHGRERVRKLSVLTTSPPASRVCLGDYSPSLQVGEDPYGIPHSPSVVHQDFEMRLDWKESWSEMAILPGKAPSRFSVGHADTLISELSIAEEYQGWLVNFISWPGSPCRLFLDLSGAFLILWDIVTIPLQVFEPPPHLFTSLMGWVTLIFWTLNMLLSPFVGYVKDGITVMVPIKILINYAKTWLIIDMLVIVPDWVFTVSDMLDETSQGSSGAGSSVKLLRVLRLVRMVRLLRLLKLRKVLQSINEMIDSEYLSIIANIVKMIVALLMINHAIACLWFWTASSSIGEETETWLTVHKFESSYTSWTYQYLTSLHWSLTQFTPASMSVQPQNPGERAFALTIVVFALVGFSYLVGSITGSLTQLRSMQEDASKQFWILRRYLKKNKVEGALKGRIQNYLEHAWQRQKETLAIKDIKIFNLLSEQLMAELQSELSLPHLAIHPLFKHMKTVSHMTMHRLSNKSLSRKQLAAKDNLFFQGEKATHMYMVIDGRLKYTIYNDGVDPREEQVDKNEDWISEPILWTTSWTHLGQLFAVHEAELLLIDTPSFISNVKLNPQANQLAVTYARNFLQWLRDQDPHERSDITQGENVEDHVRGFMEIEEPVVCRAESSKMSSARALSCRSLSLCLAKPSPR